MMQERIWSEVWFVAVRSRGPGGQNVNKVSSAALLIWDLENSRMVTEFQRRVLRAKLGSYFNRDGYIQLRSDEFRDLERNKSRCVEKLLLIIEKALHQPKRRIATKPTMASKVRRVNSKRQRSEVKSMRKRPTSSE